MPRCHIFPINKFQKLPVWDVRSLPRTSKKFYPVTNFFKIKAKSSCRAIFQTVQVALLVRKVQLGESHLEKLQQACFEVSAQNKEFNIKNFKSACLAVQQAFNDLNDEQKDHLRGTSAYEQLIFAFAAIVEIARAENWQ